MLVGLAAVVLLTLASAAVADSKTADGAAAATVVTPLAVRSLRGLEFGGVVASGSGAGWVVVAPGLNGAQYNGGVQQACNANCQSPHSARFEVSGEAGRSYSISAPVALLAADSAQPSPSESVRNQERQALQISAIRIKTGSRPAAGPVGQINISGHDQFDLGGTLQVPAGAAAAHYQANLPIIMAYD